MCVLYLNIGLVKRVIREAWNVHIQVYFDRHFLIYVIIRILFLKEMYIFWEKKVLQKCKRK